MGWLFPRALRLPLTALALVACTSDAERSEAPLGGKGGALVQPGPGEGVAVSHERELRGAWISTVWNGTWPSRQGLPPDEAKRELLAIFDALAAIRMNAVFFQVRAESDAVYASALEPWSRFLTGTQGQDPGWDPLAFAVEEGHRRGLEVHAWMNPYRGLVSRQIEVAEGHVTKRLPGATRTWGAQLWMDPGVPEVRAHIAGVVRDLLGRYDVDGLHFDDYFYPYPVAGQTFDDAASFAAYTKAGGDLGRDDWRRHNVDELVRETSELVASMRPDVRFGISPFGIYRPGTPPGITGLDSWATLYCDPVRWMKEGWVDYLAPQLYWPTTQSAQAFGKLVAWWATLTDETVPGNPRGRSIFVGHDATKAGEGAFTADEYRAQLDLARAERPRGVRGGIFFSAKPIVSDQAELASTLGGAYASPASSPPLASAAGAPAPTAPAILREENGAVIVRTEGARSVVLHRAAEPAGIPRLVPASGAETRVELPAGSWLLSTVDRRGVESRGTPFAGRASEK